MKCAICNNEADNKIYILKEMMFGYRDEFEYFQCAVCSCLQIKDVPLDLAKYYPDKYYSFDLTTVFKKINKFKRLQFAHLAGFKKSILGALVSIKYKSQLYEWCRLLNLRNENSSILDIGSGSGNLLIKLFNIGYKNLTGVDPFIEKDIIYNKNIRIYKTSIFELDGLFDRIMMHHTLEHMPDQQRVLKRVHELLSPTGKVLIRIPIISEPLMKKYGTNVVSLDPPRHLFIHSVKSITRLVREAGFKVTEMIYDTDLADIIGSEQYQNDITILNDERSYFFKQENSIFSRKQIKQFKKYTQELNKTRQGSSIALYLEKA